MKVGHGDPRSHRNNARRALIVRRHRELLERELRQLDDREDADEQPAQGERR